MPHTKTPLPPIYLQHKHRLRDGSPNRRQHADATHPAGAAAATASAGEGTSSTGTAELATKTRVRFYVPEFVTSFGQELAIVGSVPELGKWKTERAVRMQWAPGHSWHAEVLLPGDLAGTVEYKVCVYICV